MHKILAGFHFQCYSLFQGGAIVSRGYFTKETSIGAAVYYCIDLPEIAGSKDVSPKLIAQSLGVKIIMDDLGSHLFVDNLSAEEYIEDLTPKLTIK